MAGPLTTKVIGNVTWPDAVRAVHDMASTHDGTEFLKTHLDLLEAATSLVRAKVQQKKEEEDNEQAQEG